MKHINQIVILLSLFITCLSHAMLPDIHKAVKDGNIDLVGRLLDARTDVNFAYKNVTPLHDAAVKGNEAIVGLLLERGANVDAADIYGYTPLHKAIRYKNEAIVRLLIGGGANINAGNKRDWTPLHCAVLYNQKAIVSLLLEKGADLNAVNKGGSTPRDLANTLEKREEIQTLLMAEYGYKKEADNFEEDKEVQQEVQSNRNWLNINNVWFQRGAVTTAIAGLSILGYQLFK
ncbi:ankyrin repeat domain-containing protein [Candidatus Dependentiae bacterium]|nr:MAG: ankyrin repeat domain-containing protein [Candidatus Dependentiae bacterium]